MVLQSTTDVGLLMGFWVYDGLRQLLLQVVSGWGGVGVFFGRDCFMILWFHTGFVTAPMHLLGFGHLEGGRGSAAT